MRERRGFTIVEVVIAVALMAVGILFVLGIVPTGLFSIKQSEDTVAATAYALRLVEEARLTLPPAGSRAFTVTLNNTEFKFTREIIRVNQDLTDIVVTAHWSDTHPDIRLVTRVHAQPPGSTGGA